MAKKMRLDVSGTAAQENQQERRSGRLHFNDPNQRTEPVRAFYQWLPQILSDAPGLAWDRLPSRVMGYLIRSVGDHPDAIPITLAIGCAMHAIKHQTLLGYCRLVTQLLRALRAKSGVNELADLRSRQVWDRFVSGRMLSTGEVKRLATYDVLASAHVRPYLDGLNLRDRVIWEQYAFPPLPRGFIDQYGQRQAVHAAAQQHRKEPRKDAVLFEPESLYRAALYAVALATLALTNGSRLTELLQVSATRFETIVVDELKNQQPTGRKIGILVQNLLPKGYKTESDRQYFLVSDMAARHLAESGQLLEAAHGGSMPIVHPSNSSKEEDLYPEPYLFPWDGSPDGQLGLLANSDVGNLLRFLFHGLTLATRTGKPIRVAPHLLRHVMATHVRTVKKVPAEAVAFLLHQRVVLPDATRALTISEATAYYSRLPLERLLALLFEAQSQISSSHPHSYLHVPSPRTLAQMDKALKQIFEHWGTIGPTVLGYCSAGLCVRPNKRALCLDCPHLVPHYSNLRNARTWRKLYLLQAQLHDAHGHFVDAQQARPMIQYLDDIINIMQIQIRTRQDGGYLPFADPLPTATDEEGEQL